MTTLIPYLIWAACIFWAVTILVALGLCRAASKPTPRPAMGLKTREDLIREHGIEWKKATASGPTATPIPTNTPAARHNINRLTASSARPPTAEGSNAPHSRIISLNPNILS